MHGDEAGTEGHLISLPRADETQHLFPGDQVQAAQGDARGLQAEDAAPEALPGGLRHHHHQVTGTEGHGQGHGGLQGF